MKKLIIIPTVFLGIIGGYILAQSEIFSSAEKVSTITAAQAQAAALKAFDGKIVEFDYDHDDVVPHYDFEIVGSTEKVNLEVNASTGVVNITEREIVKNMAQPSVQQAIKKVENTGNTAVTNTQVTAQTAVQQVQEPVAKPQTIEQQVAPTKTQTTEQQVAPTKIQTNNSSASSQQTQGLITKAQAIAIAHQKANGTVTEVDYDADDFEYEIEIKNGNIEYDFEIDARTGAILSYKEDIDD